MLACLDADYRDDVVVAACVLFEAWTDAQPARELAVSVPRSAEYVPGRF